MALGKGPIKKTLRREQDLVINICNGPYPPNQSYTGLHS